MFFLNFCNNTLLFIKNPHFDKHVQSVNFLHLLVLGSTVVTCDPGPGAVPVRTFGGNTSGLWYLGGHTLHPERKKNLQSVYHRQPQTTLF